MTRLTLAAGVFLLMLLASAVAKSKIKRSAAINDELMHLPEYTKSTIEGEYIVVFHKEVNQSIAEEHHRLLSKQMYQHNSTNNAVKKKYNIGTNFKGYSAKLTQELMKQIQEMPEIQYIERNMVVTAFDSSDCVQQSMAPWGIVRTCINGKVSSYDYTYNSECNGDGVDAYIIDTGIQTDHPNFEGRVKWGFDAINSPSYEIDDNGHGTHVAGTVISKVSGLAKKATAIAVKVLNGSGYGSWEGVISGVEYVATQHQYTGRQSVANLSLGGWRNQAINDAVEAAKSVGVHMVVAAGNSRRDSCYVSPASAEVITVAASNIDDEMAYFSNYGECVQVIAPGVSITSEWPTDSYRTSSGTSMASPHVVGVLAKYLTSSSCSQDDMSPDGMEQFLTNRSIQGMISNVPSYTPNLMVFQDC